MADAAVAVAVVAAADALVVAEDVGCEVPAMVAAAVGQVVTFGEAGDCDDNSHAVDTTISDLGSCAICLDRIALKETALVKGCEHAYCVTCILRWASYSQIPLCPQCKHPFESLSVHRSLDGSIRDYLFEESVCLLLRAAWFVPLPVEAHVREAEATEEHDDFYFAYEDTEDLDDEEFYMSRAPSVRIGNRRWGDNGYIRSGRQEARPISRRPGSDEGGAGSSQSATTKEASASASKAVAGRRAKRAQKREAADKAAAAKHEERLLRLGLK